MKSLNVIQTICKVLKILATIAFVCCIVGAATSLIGAIILFCINEESALWQSATEYISDESLNLNLLRCSCVSAVVTCAISAVMSGFMKNFFADELAAGTPFDKTICKKMLKVGILYLSLSVVSVILAAIVYACFDVPYDDGSNYGGFGTGIMFILCWVICRYGADVKEIADKNIAESNYADCADCPKSNGGENNGMTEE